MKILVISGGSGSVELQKGFHEMLGYTPDNLINMYDDGKSTGIVRKTAKVLGPSDLRKNHWTKYSIEHANNIDGALKLLYTSRLNFNKLSDLKCYIKQIIMKIKSKKLQRFFISGLSSYFKCDMTDSGIHHSRDFNPMNIIYGGMMVNITVDVIDDAIVEYLNLSSKVYLSDDNKGNTLTALTDNGLLLTDEEKIVDLNNRHVRITHVVTIENDGTVNSRSTPKTTVNAIDNADIIVISSGTVWSSIIPTLTTKKIYRSLFDERRKAKIYCVLNISYDTDTVGFTIKEYYKLLKQYLPEDTIFISSEKITWFNRKNIIADDSIVGKNSKHDGTRLAKIILRDFVKHKIQGKKLIATDFDGTLHDSKTTHLRTVYNVRKLCNIKMEKVIVTGNSLKHINSFVNSFVNTGQSLMMNTIFFNNGSKVSYRINSRQRYAVYKPAIISKYLIKKTTSMIRHNFDKFHMLYKGVQLEWVYNDTCVLMRIKPFTNNLNRKLACANLNNIINNRLKAVIRGKTTIEIINKDVDKIDCFDKSLVIKREKVLYLGDEEYGNDMKAFSIYDNICVKTVKETETILDLLLELKK